MWTRDPDFRAFLFESPIAEMAAKVMQSSKAHLLWEFISIKEPNSPYPTDWHQDIAGNPVKGPHCCGTWLSLDEVTIQSGAVEYIKGSHRWGRYFQVGTKLEYYLHEEMQDDDSIRELHFEEFPDFDELRKYYEKDIVHFDVQPGDAVMHQLLTIHGAPGNFSNRRRRAIAPRWVRRQSRVRRANQQVSTPIRCSRRGIRGSGTETCSRLTTSSFPRSGPSRWAPRHSKPRNKPAVLPCKKGGASRRDAPPFAFWSMVLEHHDRDGPEG